MNLLSIMISSSTIIITILILVFMAVIGYYADKTIYSKEYKEKKAKKEKKKSKNIDNIENTRLSDLVGENVAQEEIAQTEVNNAGLVTQEPLTYFDNNVNNNFDNNVNNSLSFDNSESTNSEVAFNNQTNEDYSINNINQSQELMIDNSAEPVESQSLILTFDNQGNEQQDETTELEENSTNLNEEQTLDNSTSNNEQTSESLQFDSNATNEINDSMNSSVTVESTSEVTQENENSSVDGNTYYNNELTNISQDSDAAEATSNETLNLETRDLAEKVENNYQNINEPSVSNSEIPSHQTEEDFQMDEDLENKIKADILQSIKTIEEETMNTTNNNNLNISESSNITESTDTSLDDDLGINELPKLKTETESSKSDELAVDDIFKI